MSKTNLFSLALIAIFCMAGCSESSSKDDPVETTTIFSKVISGDNNPQITIAKLPPNSDGSDPWPDGVVAFDIAGKHYFGIAGEASDSLIIIDDKGNTISNTRIDESVVPSDYPCLNDEDFAGVAYSPDSVTVFELGAKTYLASTLRYSGAVIIYDVSVPASPVFEMITKVGTDDIVGTGVCTGYDNMTKVYPEGIASGVVNGSAYIWVANEYGNSVTSLKLETLSSAATGLSSGTNIKVTENITQQYSGNIESVKFVSGRENPSLIAVSSKSMTVHYLEVVSSQIKNYFMDYIAPSQQSEYEYTNSAVFDAEHVLITMTKPTKDSSGKTTSCAGDLLIIGHNASTSEVDVTSLPVGPMPDAVAISPNKKYAITADEQDSTAAWGKCPLNVGHPGVSILQIADDNGNLLSTPKALLQIQFTQNAKGQPREPEYIAIASDSDTVVVTLQDSHEVAVFKLSEVL